MGEPPMTVYYNGEARVWLKPEQVERVVSQGRAFDAAMIHELVNADIGPVEPLGKRCAAGLHDLSFNSFGGSRGPCRYCARMKITKPAKPLSPRRLLKNEVTCIRGHSYQEAAHRDETGRIKWCRACAAEKMRKRRAAARLSKKLCA
jgi:hypothetical protein